MKSSWGLYLEYLHTAWLQRNQLDITAALQQCKASEARGKRRLIAPQGHACAAWRLQDRGRSAGVDQAQVDPLAQGIRGRQIRLAFQPRGLRAWRGFASDCLGDMITEESDLRFRNARMRGKITDLLARADEPPPLACSLHRREAGRLSNR